MIRFGVIGAGRIGKVHSATIAANPKAKLAYIADAMPQAASDLAAVLPITQEVAFLADRQFARVEKTNVSFVDSEGTSLTLATKHIPIDPVRPSVIIAPSARVRLQAPREARRLRRASIRRASAPRGQR